MSKSEVFGSNAFAVPSHKVVRECGEVSEDHHRRDAFETHRHRIFALAVYMTGDETVAENLLADTFIQVLCENPAPDGMAVDLAFIARLQRLMPLTDCTLAINDISFFGPMHQGNVLRTELEAALLDLPVTERLIYLLRDVESYLPERIAMLLSLPEPQVKLAVMAARLRLRQLLSERSSAQSAA